LRRTGDNWLLAGLFWGSQNGLSASFQGSVAVTKDVITVELECRASDVPPF
jgi:hypothetical protein